MQHVNSVYDDAQSQAGRQIPVFSPVRHASLPHLWGTFRQHGINGALRYILAEAVDHARSVDPGGHVVGLGIPLTQVLRLFFPTGRFDNPKHVYVAYTHHAVTEIMREAYAYEKGHMVKSMSHLMGAGDQAADIITADMHQWHKMQPVIKSFIWGENIHKQARYIEARLAESFDTADDLSITTTDIKQMMFLLIGRLMVPAYEPDTAQLRADVHEFEDLIAGTSKILFDTIFASDQFVDHVMRSDVSAQIKARYQTFYNKFAAVRYDDDGGMLTALMGHPEYDEEKRQATVIGMFEAGSKTLAQVTTEAFYACAHDRALWEHLKANPDRKTLTAAFLEAARRTPPVDLTFREAQHDLQLAGYTIPAGSIMILSVKDMLIDPDYWEAPQAFRLNREDPERRRYLPWLDPLLFERGCTGMPYAISVGIATLQFFLERFDAVTLEEDYGMKYDATTQHNVRLRFTH
ncbi:MAG: cytochrome P450 [Anaerolineales bacterium]